MLYARYQIRHDGTFIPSVGDDMRPWRGDETRAEHVKRLLRTIDDFFDMVNEMEQTEDEIRMRTIAYHAVVELATLADIAPDDFHVSSGDDEYRPE